MYNEQEITMDFHSPARKCNGYSAKKVDANIENEVFS